MSGFIISDEVKAKLLPYQIHHTENLITNIVKHNRALDTSDTGTGKTFTNIAASITVKKKALVICPKTVIPNWKAVFDHFGVDYYGISNYESMQNCKMFTKQSKFTKVKCPFIRRIELEKYDPKFSNGNDDNNNNDDNDDDSDDIEENKVNNFNEEDDSDMEDEIKTLNKNKSKNKNNNRNKDGNGNKKEDVEIKADKIVRIIEETNLKKVGEKKMKNALERQKQKQNEKLERMKEQKENKKKENSWKNSKGNKLGNKLENDNGNKKRDYFENKGEEIRRKEMKKKFGLKEENIEPDEDMDVVYIWENIPDDMIVIFDEVHRCKNPKTLNSVLLYTLAKTNATIVMLSATTSDKPHNFALPGYVLGLYSDIRKANNWMISVSKGYEHVMAGVHNVLYPEYASRIKIKDLGDLFPKNTVKALCYNMENAEEIQEQYELIEEEVERLRNMEEASGCALARILYCRMKIEQLKCPTYIEEAKKYVEAGNSVAIFVNFTHTLKLVADELKTSCIIYGQQTLEERTKAIEDFKADKSRVIVCNIRSGGVGVSLHDLNGKYPRVSIISPGYSSQDIIQALGRIHRANGKTPVNQFIIFAADTIEEGICANMRDKIENIALLNDGNLGSYSIEGLIDGQDMKDKDFEKSELEKVLSSINALTMKKERLKNDLKDTVEELATLNTLLNSLIR